MSVTFTITFRVPHPVDAEVLDALLGHAVVQVSEPDPELDIETSEVLASWQETVS